MMVSLVCIISRISLLQHINTYAVTYLRMEITLKIVVFIGLYYRLVYRLNNQMSTWQMIRYVDQMTKSAYEMTWYINFVDWQIAKGLIELRFMVYWY